MKQIRKINIQMRIFTAFAMIFVVAYHAGPASFGFFLFDYFPAPQFTLPMFLAISGYFYDNKSILDFKSYVLKKIKYLMIPMYLWNFVYGFIYNSFFTGLGGVQPFNVDTLLLMPLWRGNQFGLNCATWFIAPLFFAELINVVLHKVVNNFVFCRQLYFIVLYLFIGMIGFGLAKYGYAAYPWMLLLIKIMTFLGFIAMGMAYKEYGEKHDTFPNTYYFALVILAQLFLIYVVEIKMHISLSISLAWMSNIHSVYIPYIAALVGMAFWLRISKIIAPLCNNKNNLFLIIGKHSYSIMVHQILGMMLVKAVFIVGNEWLNLFSDFEFYKFSHKIWYYYYPGNMTQFFIIYVAAGILFPLLIVVFENRIRYRIKKWYYRNL
jgi:fucose 4-O-acetylase-like acetyltransferase